MKLIQTQNIKKASKKATQLDVERILTVRQPYYSDFYLRNLETGLAGEEKVLEFLNTYGEKDWEGLQNIWLNDGGKFECDMLLLTKAGVHTFEIKHYNGHFVYQNGDCILNNKVLADNPVTQAQRNFRKLEQILHKFDSRLKVYGALIFVGEHNTVEIHSPISDITIVKPTELKEYILKMAEADQYHMQPLNTKKIINHLEKYEDVNSFITKPLGPETMKSIRKGIYCKNCHNFQITISKLYIHCKCGYKESREKGTLRAIYEYSMLTGKGKITLREALDFIEKKASDKYLSGIMNKQLVRVKKGKYSYYLIDPIPFQ